MENRFLKLEVIWKDDDLFELQISVSNGRYSGKIEIYETKDSLHPFAESLKGFPNGKDMLMHACGEKDSDVYFEMKFYQIGNNGIIRVQISLEEKASTEYRKDKLILELIVEPNAIDLFQRELIFLAENEHGKAELFGIRRYANNVN